jgi:uncharacterized NAD(P)/FAD-binding protein YdhS
LFRSPLPPQLSACASRLAAWSAAFIVDAPWREEDLAALRSAMPSTRECEGLPSVEGASSSFTLAAGPLWEVVLDAYRPHEVGVLACAAKGDLLLVVAGRLTVVRVDRLDTIVEAGAHLEAPERGLPWQADNREDAPLVVLRVARMGSRSADVIGASPRRIAVVGGGFSGAAVLVHLLRGSREKMQIAWVERGPRLGLGIAYGAERSELLLNVPAARMSIDPAEASDFAAFAGVLEKPSTFCSRALYGRYIATRVAEAIAASAAEVTVHRSTATTVSAREVVLADGSRCEVDHTVLATGIAPRTEGLPFFGEGATVDGWNDRAVAAIRPTARVLVLGTGLTALDVVATLASAGFQGQVTMVSRRGLLPAAHLGAPVATPDHVVRAAAALLTHAPTSLAGRVHAVRIFLRDAQASGLPWQAAVDALRPHVPALWRALSPRDRRRFVRRVRPHWDVVRHRAPHEALDRVHAWRSAGRLAVIAASVSGSEPVEGVLRVALRERGGAVRMLEVDVVVRCIGPAVEDSDLASPLLRSMIERGDAMRDEAGLGIRVDAEGRVFDASGCPSDRISALGALRRAEAWETTAVPEIARDAKALAARVLASFEV